MAISWARCGDIGMEAQRGGRVAIERAAWHRGSYQAQPQGAKAQQCVRAPIPPAVR